MPNAVQSGEIKPQYGPGEITLDRWDGMPADYKKMTRRLVGGQLAGEMAACETFGRCLQFLDDPQQYRHLAKTVLEESTHVRLLADLAPRIGIDVGEIMARRRPLATWFLGERDDVTSWTEICVFKWLIDRAGSIWLWSMRDTSFKPYRDTMGRIMADEARHQADGGRDVLLEIAKERRGEVQRLVDYWFPRAIQLLGRPESEGNRVAARLGLKHADSVVEMRKYLDEILPTVLEGGLTLPTPDDLRARGVEFGDLTW